MPDDLGIFGKQCRRQPVQDSFCQSADAPGKHKDFDKLRACPRSRYSKAALPQYIEEEQSLGHRAEGSGDFPGQLHAPTAGHVVYLDKQRVISPAKSCSHGMIAAKGGRWWDRELHSISLKIFSWQDPHRGH